MTFLLGYWRYAAIALLVAAYTGFVYHAGGNTPRYELKVLQAASDAYKQESSHIAKEKDRDYEMQMANTQYAWDQYRLQHPITKPSRVNSEICADTAGNDQLSAALGDYLDAVGRFRNEAQELVESCAKQQVKLNSTIEWAQTINR